MACGALRRTRAVAPLRYEPARRPRGGDVLRPGDETIPLLAPAARLAASNGGGGPRARPARHVLPSPRAQLRRGRGGARDRLDESRRLKTPRARRNQSPRGALLP